MTGGWAALHGRRHIGQLMNQRVLTRILPTALAVVLAVASSGQVVAYWSGLGAGTGSAAAGTAVAVTLTPGTPSATLYPGAQTAVVLSVSNPNAIAMHIGSLALDSSQGTGGWAIDAGHSGCSVVALTYTTQSNGGAGWTIPEKVGAIDGTLAITLANSLALGVDAANACQGASLTVYLEVGP